MKQFATAWVAPAGTIGFEDCQVLVYLSQEPNIWLAHHRCMADGVYMEMSLKWERSHEKGEGWATKKAWEYIDAAKEVETRSDINEHFKTQLGKEWPIP